MSEEPLYLEGRCPRPIRRVGVQGQWFSAPPFSLNHEDLNPASCSLHTTPNTLHPTPFILHPEHYTLHPKPQTPKPQTPDPKPQTANSKPQPPHPDA